MVYDKETISVTEYDPDSGPPDEEILIYRFGSALLFYNASYFAERIMARVESKKDLRLVVIDARPINMIDLTALAVLKDLITRFNAENVTVVFAGANESFRSRVFNELERNDLNTDIFYPSVHSALTGQ
jgi:SulP family sulfate permease